MSEARTNWNKDAAFRQWATRHGGVYVPPDERTPPNPAMAHVPDRDVVTTDGKHLTLMNPAYMMRQMTQEFEAKYGIKGKITGKKQLNPLNAPDDWELKALNQFETGRNQAVVEQTQIASKPFLRYMKPMYMTEGCDKCHAILGYKEGDLRGGVSIAIPLQPYFMAAEESRIGLLTTHLFVWLIATAVIFLFALTFIRFFRRLSYNALHDNLTGLPNLVLLKDRIEQNLLRRVRDPDYQFAVCFLDLDRFKNINDSHGHATGDQLLKQAAEIFTSAIRAKDTVARMGGDEFTFLISDLKDIDEAIAITQRILQKLESPFVIGNERLYTNASIGICLADNSHQSPEELIRDADIAMYRAKERGKGCIDLFNPQMRAQTQQTQKLENDLREAISKQQLEIYYQPVIDVSGNRITGFEALVRWNHPELGRIAPGQFIPLAERCGRIQQIDLWVLEHACRQLQVWNRRNQTDFSLSTNLCSADLADPMLSSKINKVLQETRFAPDKLHVEVTESMLLSQPESGAQVLQQLRKLGVGISIDDFGTGYCSLKYLQDYPFDTLKVDRSFVQGLRQPGKSQQLIRNIIRLGHDLGLVVLAEGVEQASDLDCLTALGCNYVQGFYYAAPMPVRIINELLHRKQHLDADSLISPSTACV